MLEAEFDKFADEYRTLHAQNIRVSGEPPEFFAEYKVKDVAERLSAAAGSHAAAPAILDFGGGIGTSVPYFRKYFPGVRLTCLDVSKKSLALARERFAGMAEFVCFDGKIVPFPEYSFDVAFAACVFHHIDECLHAHLLGEIHRVLNPGGMVFVFEHNPFNPLTNRAVAACAFDANARLIAASRMRRRLVDAGFANACTRYRIFFPGWLSRLRSLETYLAWMPLGAQYCAIGRKHA